MLFPAIQLIQPINKHGSMRPFLGRLLLWRARVHFHVGNGTFDGAPKTDWLASNCYRKKGRKQTRANMSSSDRFPLTLTGENTKYSCQQMEACASMLWRHANMPWNRISNQVWEFLKIPWSWFLFPFKLVCVKIFTGPRNSGVPFGCNQTEKAPHRMIQTGREWDVWSRTSSRPNSQRRVLPGWELGGMDYVKTGLQGGNKPYTW